MPTCDDGRSNFNMTSKAAGFVGSCLIFPVMLAGELLQFSV